MPSSTNWKPIYNTLSQHLKAAGYDIVTPFNVESYNAAVDSSVRIATRTNSCNTFGVLIGNTRRLWDEKFIKCLRRHSFDEDGTRIFDWETMEHPVDEFIMETITTAVVTNGLDALPNSQSLLQNIRFYWGHEYEPDKLIAIQRLGEIAHVAKLHPTSHLSIHPIYGPWLSFRCAIVFTDLVDGLDAMEMKEIQDASTLDTIIISPEEEEAAKEKMELAIKALNGDVSIDQIGELNKNWRAWLEVRDVFSIGKEWRYSEPQLEYHYSKNKSILRNLAMGHNPSNEVI